MRPLRTLDLFSGIGGISLGLESTGGFSTVAFCETDKFCQLVLRHHWLGVPVFGNIKKLKGSYFDAGEVEVICGGFPCQPFSVAGKRRAQADERHLWPEFARLVRELRPRWVLAENVPGLRSTAADEVLGDLEEAGYAAWACVVGADDAGAPHRRKRVWIVGQLGLADSDSAREPDKSERGRVERESWAAETDASGRGEYLGEPTGAGLEGQRANAGEPQEPESRNAGALPNAEGERRPEQRHGRHAGSRLGCDGPRWPARPGEQQHDWEEPRLAQPRQHEPDRRASRIRRGSGGAKEADDSRSSEQPLGKSTHGLPERLARRANREALKALGNSVVPQVVQAVGKAILETEWLTQQLKRR